MTKVLVYHTPLAAAIRLMRARLEISQLGLSRILSVAPQTVLRWEHGDFVPNRWQLINLYRHARTEEEIGPILKELEAKGISLSVAGVAALGVGLAAGRAADGTESAGETGVIG